MEMAQQPSPPLGLLCVLLLCVIPPPTYALSSVLPVQTNSPSSTTTKQQQQPWFSRRIQDTFDYEQSVQRLYLRHIVTETQSMATEAVKFSYAVDRKDGDVATPNNNIDPFGAAAKAISACSITRDEGGTIGWVERDFHDSVILCNDVVTELFQQQPKAGDVVVLSDADNDRWHVIQVAEIWLHASSVMLPTDELRSTNVDADTRIGSFSGTNRVLTNRRRKLKGQGVTSSVPKQLSTYSIQTSGCQMNVADSERLAGILHNDLRMTSIENSLQSDVVIFNTCSIRDRAEQKLYNTLGPYAAAKRKGKKQALIVTGCVAQQEGEALLRRVPEIDAVLGPQYVPHLRNVLEQVSLGHQMVATAPTLIQEDNFLNPPLRGHSVRAWVNIIFGCNEHCTYCVVPATRGIEQSRTPEAILNECRALAAAGYKECTLLGQNIDAYGRDMVPKRTFAELLEYLNANLEEKMRIRYVTSHPRYFTDRVIDAVANLDKVCECFHMPFQAGDDNVLKDMRRGYTYDSYMKIIQKIKAKAPDAAICADIIVGFPGETEAAFQKTLELMEEVKFDNVNSFAYSPRPNTEAGLWDNQIDDDIKADRLQRVQKLATEHGMERSQRYVGRIEEVLVEDSNPRNRNQVMGRTRQGRQVYFDGSLDDLQGQFVDVEITAARTWSLMGRLAE